VKALWWMVAVALAALITAPALTKFIHAAIPLLAVLGLIAALLRVVWFYTR
jgi:hypothetical protein